MLANGSIFAALCEEIFVVFLLLIWAGELCIALICSGTKKQLGDGVSCLSHEGFDDVCADGEDDASSCCAEDEVLKAEEAAEWRHWKTQATH